jgi:hypothetical protein
VGVLKIARNQRTKQVQQAHQSPQKSYFLKKLEKFELGSLLGVRSKAPQKVLKIDVMSQDLRRCDF